MKMKREGLFSFLQVPIHEYIQTFHISFLHTCIVEWRELANSRGGGGQGCEKYNSPQDAGPPEM
jgi:hypothetical protein